MRRSEGAMVLALSVAWVALVRPGPLSLPYFWDAADVYVPGARWLVDHGFDITPGVFDDDYSRGHPQLFYLYLASVFFVFGDAPTVGHLAVVPFTAIGLFATYALGRALFSWRVGASAAALLAVTPLYMSIGNTVLPEVPLTALTVLAFLALARGRLGIAIALATACVMLKETGIFTGAAVGLAVLYDGRTQLRDRATWGRIALCLSPLAVLIGFFVWQRLTAGYYVFPHHEHLLVDRPFGARDLLTVLPSTLVWHGRGALTLAALLAVFAGFRPDPPESVESSRYAPSRGAVVVGLLGLLVFNALFFAKMFWLERYALPAHPGLLILAAAAVLGGFASWPRVARTTARGLLVFVACFLGVAGLRSPAPEDAEEHTFAYADVIRTHLVALATLEPDDAPVVTTWPLTVELEQPSLGYVTRPLRTIHPRDVDETTALSSVVVNGASSHAEELRTLARARGFVPSRFQIGLAPSVEVYRAE